MNHLSVLDPGLLTLVVDGGRPSQRSLGVPLGGAADRFALALGNALVGNPPYFAALEITLQGPTLHADADLGAVIFGAPFESTIDDRPIMAGNTFTLRAGEILHVGPTPKGMRAYLCVHGGLCTTPVLGSRSSLEPIRPGAELPFVSSTISHRLIQDRFGWNAEPFTIRILPGLQAEWFPKDCLHAGLFTIGSSSNRMGLRLQGRPLPVPDRELVSEPVAPGSVQVTRDGQLIILGVDGQTIGGYPKIAQVITADLDKLAQLRPGETVHLAEVSQKEAEVLFDRKQAELHEWLTRLAVADGR
jgi:5-oxoprolinase (ATP-hydrolysing) subunit C